MPGVLEIITTVIGLFMLFSVAIFILSIVRKWEKPYKIYWGFVVFICVHMFLFALVLFVQTTKLPSILIAYTFGVLSLLYKIVGI